MFCETKTIVEPMAYMSPRTLADNSKEHASMTPRVRGSNDKYVDAEYCTRNMNRYVKTVNSGESACHYLAFDPAGCRP